MATLEKAKTLEEKRAALIIKYRNLSVDSVEKKEEKIIYRLSKGDKKHLMHILLNLKTIGIAYIRELRDEIEVEKVAGGIIVADGKYTYSARSNAPEMNIELIDMVVVNLYPFEKTVAEEGVTLQEAVEQIDIGGPTMLRSAAKNFQAVAVVTSPDQYEGVIDQLKKHNGGLDLKLRLELARAVFERTCKYDQAISTYLKEIETG